MHENVKPIFKQILGGKGALPLHIYHPSALASCLSYTLFSPFRRLCLCAKKHKFCRCIYLLQEKFKMASFNLYCVLAKQDTENIDSQV